MATWRKVIVSGSNASLGALALGGVAVTSTAAELNILDGVTSTAAELNILDGVTSTAAELNALDGITAVVGELNALDIGSTAVGTAVASKAVILDSNKDYTGIRNLTVSGELDAATGDFSGAVDIAGDLTLSAGADGALTFGAASSIKIVDNQAASLVIEEADTAYMTFKTTNSSELITTHPKFNAAGGILIAGTTVTSTAAELNILDGVTSTAAELNILDGVTSTAAELNILDGVTSTATELNIIDGNTSATSTTIADADRIVLNDNGTMVQVAVTDMATYIGAGAADDIGAGDAAVEISTTSGNVVIDSNAGAVSIDGHTGVTLASSNSGDITLDSVADINLDAAGNDIHFKAGGTHVLSITNSSSDVIIKPIVDAKDLIFQQRDGTAVLTIEDNATANIPDGKLALGGTAVTSTAAELNILDGVTSTAAELNILDGVTSTAAEINLIDGGTARGTTAIADGDGFLTNDGGTMRMTKVDTLATYISGKTVGGTGIVTTGVLNAGSINTGFGNINNGASTITTTGLISGGSLDIDNVLINGTTIGHTDDTDLMTVADGLLTVAGEVQMTTLDIGGTNVTSTAAELNALDGITAVVAELNMLDLGDTSRGTAVASKAVVLDSNKDYTGIRNLTVSGELDAATGDFSGAVDIAGNLVVQGDLLVSGDVTEVNTANLNVEDQFILLNSGSINTDVGIIFGGTHGTVNTGKALVWDHAVNHGGGTDGRLAVKTNATAANTTTAFAAGTTGYYLAGVFRGSTADAATALADHEGNIRIESNELFMYF